MLNFSSPKTFYVISAIMLFLLFYSLFFSAPNNFLPGSVINIREDSSLRYISKYLEENRFIRSRALFETFVIIWGGEKHIVPGDYLFENKLSVFEVARRVSKGERHLAPVKVTIPEGFSVFDISEVFAFKLPNFNEERFLIEEESKGDIDREFISGILWKRLAMNMPLQVDAELNTYKTKGLPKNPISNPGIKAIKATLYPKISDYLYYLHDEDGNVHYAKTFEEHKLNKQKYLK